MNIWKFTLREDTVSIGNRTRRRLTANGCNEPFKGRYWCPKLQWFRKEACPFANRNECDVFESMCGCV